jgi:hypothetical protein
MRQTIEKLASLERDIASEKGEFSLFALFLREDADETWDLLASAPWLEADKRESLEYLVNEIRARLDTQELLSLSRIVLAVPHYRFTLTCRQDVARPYWPVGDQGEPSYARSLLKK